MRIDRLDNNIIEISLSKRNCLALAAKANDPNSQKTLYKTPGPEQSCDRVLIVHVEPDEIHYARPEGDAGPVHPEHDPNPKTDWDSLMRHGI